MKINRTKNAVNGVIFGSLSKLITIIFPFVTRTIIIYILGVQYLGLSSLFTSILQILSLAELGFGTALTFSMYKPIAEDDEKTINALLNLYKKIYRTIGTIVFVVGLAFLPVLRYLIKGDCPSDVNIYILYLIYLFNNVISYLFFAYRTSLLTAHQRNDIASKIAICSSVFMYVGQILALLLFKNYYIYTIFIPLSTLANNIIVLVATKKIYPQYKCVGSISGSEKAELKKQVFSLFLHRIGCVVQASIDNICISVFMGLVLLGKYNNYYYVVTAVQAFIMILKQSMLAGIGNSLIVESKEYNKKHFNKILFIMLWIIGWCATCLMCLFQPFMQIWVGVDNMLPLSVVISLVVLFYVNEIRGPIGLYKDALGMWYEDRFKPISISAVNLVLTIICVYFGFLEGVILATATAYLFVGMPWETKVFFKHYMEESSRKYYFMQLFYFIANLVSLGITYLICSLIPSMGVAWFIVRIIICVLVPNIVFVTCNIKNPILKDVLKSSKRIYRCLKRVKGLLLNIYGKLPYRIYDDELLQNNRRHKIMLKLERKYKKYINKTIVSDDKPSDYVFTCWLQGEENAPELVKKCIESMRLHFKDKKLVVITEKNLKDYTDLPEFIYKKWQNGIITNTHFSDIVRANLLIKNGGLWLDSTVLCTGNMNKYIDEKDNLFVFRNEHRGSKSICLSSWLIYAKKNNPILVNTQNLLYRYWEKNNKLIDYFLFHILFTIVSKEFGEEWNNVPAFSNIDPHMLWFYLFYEKFDKKRINQIKEMSNFHKLSYKFDESLLKEDSFYEHLIKGDYEKN